MKYLSPFLLLLSSMVLLYCQPTGSATAPQEEAPLPEFTLESSPVVPAEQSVRLMEVEDGFEVQLVAAEPLVNTPVAMTFDGEGRMWVVEMQGYMPDTVGTGEEVPNGKIVILEDTNQDGVADKRHVFLDSLVLPRAISLVEGGILVAEPPMLWYYEIDGNKPGKRTLVDAEYAKGGNVEHQPNGLLRAMDNWIYSAKSDKRYRKVGDKWVKENTHFRGQWGISQDDYGRLYYNTNSENLLGDYFAPGFGASNKHQRGVAGYVEKIVANNKVYPIRPTPGVNRGYMDRVLDDSLKLVTFTAASSPLVYRGGLFGDAYASNVFVAEPAGNLIKRNILKESGYQTSGEQAYSGKEFLASVDERFRPVSLYNAPDGALYVVDMYRGIIQHKTYLTTYLKSQIGKRDLTQPLGYGRIYRIVPKGKQAQSVALPTDPQQLVRLLGHANGWVRDNAQQKLIDHRMMQAIPALRQAARQITNPLQAVHALWTLEGMGAMETEDVTRMVRQGAWPLRMQALAAMPSVLTESNAQQLQHILLQLATTDQRAAPYVAYLAAAVRPYNQAGADELLLAVAKAYPNDVYAADAIVSNLYKQEEAFQRKLLAAVPGNGVVHRQVQEVVAKVNGNQKSRSNTELLKEFPKGAAMYASTCQTCHGPDGNGVKSLAPPLNKSEWVTGNKNKLISIVLYGMTGPVEVNGHLYKAPEINGDMPGIGYDKTLSSADVAELLSYIRKAWQNNADKVTAEEVGQVRQYLHDRQKAFTMKELNNMP